MSGRRHSGNPAAYVRIVRSDYRQLIVVWIRLQSCKQRKWVLAMALFLIERNWAEQLEVTSEAAAEVTRVNDDVGVKWLFSFLTSDKKKTYCLYEAVSVEAIRQAAERAGIPADVIVEVSELRPEMFGVAL